jgi:hypothetical protein
MLCQQLCEIAQFAPPIVKAAERTNEILKRFNRDVRNAASRRLRPGIGGVVRCRVDGELPRPPGGGFEFTACDVGQLQASPIIRTVSRYGARRRPRSSALMLSTLRRARSASSSCDRRASRRGRRRTRPNDPRSVAALSTRVTRPARSCRDPVRVERPAVRGSRASRLRCRSHAAHAHERLRHHARSASSTSS